MNSQLQSLLALKDVDSEMFLMLDLKEKRPLEFEREAERLKQAERGVEAIREEIKKIRMECDKGELDVKQNQAEAEKLQVALNTAKTNEEYQVLKGQLEKLSEKRGEIEEQILIKFDDIDTLTAREQEALAAVETAKTAVAAKQKDLDRTLEEIDGRIENLKSRREEALADVSNDTLEIYRRVLSRYRESALAQVENGVCQGCYMNVTRQDINRLRVGEDLVQCRNCMRILYLADM